MNDRRLAKLSARSLAASLIVLLIGCGPTHTPGTRGAAAKDLAILSIAQLPDVVHVQIHSVQFDDQGDQFSIGNGRDFYLTPGKHTASFTFIGRVPGPAGLFVPKDALTFKGPIAVPLGAFAAGKEYELAPTVDGFDKLMQQGELSLVREKEK